MNQTESVKTDEKEKFKKNKTDSTSCVSGGNDSDLDCEESLVKGVKVLRSNATLLCEEEKIS